MLLPSIVAVTCLFIGAHARYFKRHDGITISSYKLSPRSTPSEIAVTDVVLPLTKKSSSGSRRALSALVTIPTGNETALISGGDEEFYTAVTWGTETFEMIVDTGSSDTWVVETGFTCVSTSTGATTTEADCDFGPYYTKSSTFVALSGLEFSIAYGDGSVYVTGVMGTEEITVAGIKVDQEVALVTNAAWQGDGVTSGIMGLAYPALTSAYKGTPSTSDHKVYNPIFTTMYNDGLIANDYFSLLIERQTTGPAGYLAFGGVPDVAFTHNFTSTPIIVTTISGYPDSLDFYTINIVSMLLNGVAIANSGGTTREYIVDSGTTLNYVPTSVATAINAAFSPAATYSSDYGVYVVSCTAKPPTYAINIANVIFTINPLDMIIYDSGLDICYTGIMDGGSSASADIYILGDTFQKNVVSLFDVGASVMQFAGREFYPSDDTY